jgi:uncharacterized phage protein gp47/JayE
MSDFRIPPISELITETVSRILTNRSTASMARGSDGYILSRTLAHLAHGLHLSVSNGLRNLIPTLATGVAQSSWAWLFGLPDGSGGYGRIIARGCDTGTVTVTATGISADLQNREFLDPAGRRYKITESHAFGGAGTWVYDIAGVDTGLATNLELADAPALTWVSTPANVTTIVIASDFDNGANAETDPELQVRIKEYMQRPPQSGNGPAWERWIEDAIPGAVEGYVWTKRQDYPQGWGTVDYMVLQKGESRTARTATAAQLALVAANIVKEAPVREIYSYRAITPATHAVPIEVRIYVLDGYEDDFDAIAAAKTVVAAGCSEATRKVDFSGDVSAILSVDDRIVIDGVEAVVSVVSPGADVSAVTVADWPEAWNGTVPTNGYKLCAGGGPVMAYHAAILAYVDSLGPCHDYDTNISPATWDDTVRSWRIKALAKDIPGIYDVTVTDIGGGGDVDHASSPGIATTSQLLYAGEIVVRVVH